MLATEETTQPAPEGESPSMALETHATNARMRHIPSAEAIASKLDSDVRYRAETLLSSIAGQTSTEPYAAEIQQQLRLLGRALDRVAEVARQHRGHPHPPQDLASHIRWSIDQTITALHAAEESFGRRFPFHTGERSSSEPLWGAFLKVLWHLQRLGDLVRTLDPSVDERLLEGLVKLNEPLRREPIA